MAEMTGGELRELRDHYRGEYYNIPVFPGANIGALGLRHTVELPPDYRYAANVTPAAGSTLLRANYPGMSRFSSSLWIKGDADESHAHADILYVGVETHHNGRLVGLGRLSYREYTGVLASFVVDTGHRSKGIGRAIIDSRIRFADQLGLVMLVMPKLADTNTLESYYRERGFRRLGDGRLVRTGKAVLEHLTAN